MAVRGCIFCGFQIRYHGEPEGNTPIEHVLIGWNFIFFDHLLKSMGSYAPNENFSTEPLQPPFDFGSFWNDILWFEITENSTPTSEVLRKFPGNRWLAKNEFEMRLYADEARKNCVGQYLRFSRPETVTVQTMSLDAFKKMLASYDEEIDWFYQGVGYEFLKEKISGGRIKILVNRDFDNPKEIFSATFAAGEDFTETLVNAKIFPDGKSIVEAQEEIKL